MHVQHTVVCCVLCSVLHRPNLQLGTQHAAHSTQHTGREKNRGQESTCVHYSRVLYLCTVTLLLRITHLCALQYFAQHSCIYSRILYCVQHSTICVQYNTSLLQFYNSGGLATLIITGIYKYMIHSLMHSALSTPISLGGGSNYHIPSSHAAVCFRLYSHAPQPPVSHSQCSF